MNKYEYIIKHLSKTYKKNHENYVINRIYNLVNNTELVPEGQRYISCKEGTYLIDLYFPQINVGIECDELHHRKQKIEDAKREMNISDVLSRVREDDSYYPIHIDIGSYDYIKINKKIDDAVNKINKKIIEHEKKNHSKLNFEGFLDGQIFNKKKESIISTYNDYRFKTINEVNNQVLNGHTKYQQHAYYHLNDKYYAWFPKLVLDNGKAPTKWVNELSRDGETIIEYNSQAYDKTINKKYDEGHLRVTFARVKDPVTNEKYYRFVGVFKKVAIKNGKHIYKLVSRDFGVIK